VDVSGVALLHPSQIQHYTYGGCHVTLETHECLDGIFKLLRLDPSISLIQPLEAAQLLVLGEAPSRWTRSRHFLASDSVQQPYIPTACGPWHDVGGHFFTLYTCKDYWSLLDPLRDLPRPPQGMQSKLHAALREQSFRARNLPIPTLPQYRQVPRVAVLYDAQRLAWSSCATIAMCTALHLLPRNWHPHELPGLYITRIYMLALHRALLEWLIAGTPPALVKTWCLHQDIHPPTLAHTGPYPMLSISATTLLTKGQPWRPERLTYVGPPSTMNPTPSSASDGPHTSHHMILSPLAPTGHLSVPCAETGTMDSHMFES